MVFASALTGRLSGAPIHGAVQANDVARIGELAAEDPTTLAAPDLAGLLPLHLAAKLDRRAAASALIEAGADVDRALKRDGYTPLHVAASANATNVAALLVRKGAKTDVKSLDGRTPLQVAVKQNAQGVIRLLAGATGVAYKDPALDDRFKEGEDAYRSGDMARAYSILNKLVREDPGNERINFALGMTCKSMKELSRAQLAFERVLQINDNNDRARLELAAIHMQRNDYASARRLFEQVLAHNPPEAVRRNIDLYLSRIRASEKKRFVSGRLDLGWTHDSNVNVGPSSDVISIDPITVGAFTIDTLTVEDPSQPTESDGTFAAASLSGLVDGGSPGGWMGMADVTYYETWLSDVEGYESRFYQLSAGGRRVGKRSAVQVPVFAAHIDSGGEALSDLYGVLPSVSAFLGRKADWQSLTGGRMEYRDYDTLDDRDGLYVSVLQSLKRFDPSRKQVLTLGILLSHDYTDAKPYENSGIGWIFGMDFRLPMQANLYGRVKYQKNDYAEREPLAPEVRKDRQTQVSVGVNKMLTRWMTLAVGHQHTDNDSTFGLYAYERDVTTISTSLMF